MIKKKVFLAIIAFSLVAGFGLAQAEEGALTTATGIASTTIATTSTANTSTTSIETVISLLKQIEELRKTLITTLISMTESGRSGVREIKALQTLLASDKELYPQGLVTGYLGPLTRKAMFKFKEKRGLGTTTPSSLRGPARLLLEGAGNSGHIPPGLLRAPGLLKKGIGATTTISTTTNNTSPTTSSSTSSN